MAVAIAVLGVVLSGCGAAASSAGSPLKEVSSPSNASSASSAIISETTATPDASEEPALPTLPPFPGVPTLGGRESVYHAGCRGTIYYLTKAHPADQCGLTQVFGEVRRLDAITVSPGRHLLIEAPDGYSLSVADARLAEGWSVKIAPSNALRPDLPIGLHGMPRHIGKELGRGLGPDTAVRVKMPAQEGTYIVELTAPLARDGWTFPGSLYYWLVKVG